MLIRSLSLSSLCLSLVQSRLHSLPDDTFAFPKYRVTFLNALPLLNETAQKWLKDGLRGGELEFLDQPWKEESWHEPISLKEIGNGDDQARLGADDVCGALISSVLVFIILYSQHLFIQSWSV
jgi:hypothetical protein